MGILPKRGYEVSIDYVDHRQSQYLPDAKDRSQSVKSGIFRVPDVIKVCNLPFQSLKPSLHVDLLVDLSINGLRDPQPSHDEEQDHYSFNDPPEICLQRQGKKAEKHEPRQSPPCI
jgi:hypothetical protein